MTPAQLSELFLPHIVDAVARIRAGKRLVHYTTAEAGYRIITGRQVWLRNVHLMNDYSEMKHGLSCLQGAWGSPSGLTFQKWLDECWPGLRGEVESTFNSHVDGLTNSTFLMSLSEHDDDEDEYGRLSMWRAYGAKSGIALILNPGIFISSTDAMKVYSSPVVYRDVADFVVWFGQWTDSLIAAKTRLDAVERHTVHYMLFYAFRTFVLATKHPGFKEEQEWRVFHSPTIEGPSAWVSYEVEVIAGAPQHVVKVALRDDVAAGVLGIDPSLLVNRVIVGPCESPLPIRNALGFAMGEAGVADYGNKIWMSFIPLRHR